MVEPTKDELIRRAERLKAFLADEVVVQAFDNLDKDYFEQWKAGATPAERELLWAKGRALDELRGAFRAIVDAGIVASADTPEGAPRPDQH